jgi:ubiquinone/menaquinone biosynthesis C-methylase UbiE
MTVEGKHTDIAQESLHAIPYRFAFNSSERGCRALDVGVGDGASLKRAIEWSEVQVPSSILGIDVCSSILLTLPEETGILPINADGLYLPFGDETFPLVISSQVIEHIERRSHSRFLEELIRVTERDGRVIISTMNKEFPYYVKGHKSHLAEFDTRETRCLAETCGQFGETEIYAITPSQRFMHAYSQRARFWFLRPVKNFVPRRLSELVLTLLTRGEMKSGLDMRADFQIKKLEELGESEQFTDFVIEIVKKTG